MRAVYGIVAREFVRFSRQRGRVLASIGRPFVWLVFAGAGFAAVFAGRNQIDYRVYMAPGLLGMVVMFGSLLAALSTVTDREAGVLRMVLVAPIRRSTVAFGKALGATRSEEHTSELQSLAYLVCRLLLEKKKQHI